ncbi:Clp protease ClpP [Atopobiaceae bacterium FL090493]|nr:Clp protease ClpP [Atopobiaceae bacterium FL090493]
MTNKPMQLVRSEKDGAADLYIYGDIYEGAHVWNAFTGVDRGTDSLELVDALNQLPAEVGEVNVHINSYGGDVSEGVAIYTALRNCGRTVNTYVDGFACSIASVVLMAGERRVMGPASLVMVHDPWMKATGNAEELRKAAEDLDVIGQASRAAYMGRVAISAEELDRLMREETWLGAEQAVEYGFATEVAADPDENRPSQHVRDRMARMLAGPADKAPEQRVDMDALVGAVRAAVREELAEREVGVEPEPSEPPAPQVDEAADGRPVTGYRRLAAALTRD